MKRSFYLILSMICVVGLLSTYYFMNRTERGLKSAEKAFVRIHEELERVSTTKRITVHRNVEQRASQEIGKSSYPNRLFPDPFFLQVLSPLLGTDFQPHGILRTAVGYRPENLYTFSSNEYTFELYELCCVKVGKPHRGRRDQYGPDAAIKVEKISSTEVPGCVDFIIHLRKDLFWEPLQASAFPSYARPDAIFFQRHPVTARDFKLFYDAIANPYVFGGRATAWRSYCKDFIALKVIDDHTFIARWKLQDTVDEKGEPVKRLNFMAEHITMALRPIPFFVYAYNQDGTKIIEDDEAEDTYRINSVWAQNMTMHWALNYVVSCGPYIFKEFGEDRIVVERNPRYFNPLEALVEKRIICIKESPEAAFTAFKSEEIDITIVPHGDADLGAFLTSREYQAQEKKGHPISRFECFDRNFVHLGWNCQNPLFASEKIRQALSMTIDKHKIIQEFLHGQAVPVTGPFFHASSFMDRSLKDWPFDTDKAEAILEQEGWKKNSVTGIREKLIDGKLKPFAFRMHYLIKKPQVAAIVDYISDALKSIGVDCHPYGVDVADMGKIFNEKTFESLLYSWKLRRDPINPRIYWHSEEAFGKGSGNMCGFIDAEVDRLIELINYEEDSEKALEYYQQLHRLIHKKAPYTFLFSQNKDIVYRSCIKNIFVPAMRQDWFPGSEEYDIDNRSIWISK